MKIETKFNIGDEVIAKETGEQGIIKGIYIFEDETLYSVNRKWRTSTSYNDNEIELVLTQEEKAYLETVIRPFKEKVEAIGRNPANENGMLWVMTNHEFLQDTLIPITDSMKFEGLTRMFTLEELGLFEGDEE